MTRSTNALALLPALGLPWLFDTAKPRIGPGSSTAFVHCTVVPMDEPRLLEDYTVVVRDGVILAVGPSAELEIPSAARRVEARGRYLMPGLADMHTHLWENEPYLDMNLANGVTTILELSGSPVYLRWRDEIRRGEREGPTLYVSTFFDGPRAERSPHQIVRTPAEAHARVRTAKEEGFDLIKVYSFLGAETFAAVIEEAAEQGITVIGHVPHAVGPQEAMLAGQVGVVHVEEFYNNYFLGHPERDGEIDGMVEMIAALGVVVTSNTSAIEAMVKETTDLAAELAQPAVRYLPGNVVAEWGPWTNGYVNRSPEEKFGERVKVQLGWLQPFVLKLHEAGVLLLAGTDAAIPVLVPGFAIHQELAELVEIGLTPFEALACATRNADRFVAEHISPADRFGVVEVGRRADLLLLESNPLESIENVRAVVGVMARGKWYDRQELERRLAKIRSEVADANDFWRELGMGNVEEAVATFERAHAATPARKLFEEADLTVAATYFQAVAKRQDLALELLETNVRAYPESWSAHAVLGEAMAAEGLREEAIESFEQALRLDPASESCRARLRELRARPGG